MTDLAGAPRAGPARPRLPLPLRLVVVAGGALLVWLAIGWVGAVLWGEEMSLTRHVVNALSALVLGGGLVVAARRLLDRRPLVTLGLPRGAVAVRDLLLGGLAWVLPAAVGLGVALAAGWLEIELGATVVETLGAVLLLIVLVLAYEALPEELIFRGYIYGNLAATMAPWLAVVVQALVFACFGTTLWVVSQGWGVLVERLVLFFVMAVVVGGIRLVSGSVWAAVGFHLAFQVVMQLFLSGRYLEVAVSDEMTFTLATAVVAFVSGPPIAGLLWRGRRSRSRTRTEPDTLEVDHVPDRRA